MSRNDNACQPNNHHSKVRTVTDLLAYEIHHTFLLYLFANAYKQKKLAHAYFFQSFVQIYQIMSNNIK